jgi:tRNA(Ile)-lysidine synthase
MLNKFLRNINEQQLCNRSEKILVAVSGGKDSVALLHLFSEANFNIEVAHCNFGLRGIDSDEDQVFVEKLCEKLNVTFHSKKFETKLFSKKNKISTQMAARNLRYEWFAELMLKHKFVFLATAHHLNDAVETLFLNIVKGTGPTGLRSIPIKKNNIIRPLLFAKSSEIVEYLNLNHIVWQEDASNQTNDYERNKIRNSVIPLLKDINPGLEQTQLVNLNRFNALADIFNVVLKEFIDTATQTFNDKIEIRPLNWLLKPGFHLIIEEYLRPFGFNYQQVQTLLSLETTGKELLTNTHKLVIGRDIWYLSEIKQNQVFESLKIDSEGIYEINNQKWIFEVIKEMPNEKELKTKHIAFLNLSKISWPILIRGWQSKDKFQPFGMKGKKLVSDYLIDIKMEPDLKQKQLVLTQESEIIWLVNQRISDNFKLENKEFGILKINIIDI